MARQDFFGPLLKKFAHHWVQRTVQNAVGPTAHSKSVLQHQQKRPNVDKVVNISELVDVRFSATSALFWPF